MTDRHDGQARPTVGFIGLGAMGHPMASNVLKGGFPLIGYDVRAGAAESLSDLGAIAAVTCADVAARSDVIITMLPGPADVREAAIGDTGIAVGARSGTSYIDMSTTGPAVMHEVAAVLEPRGVTVLDAPVTRTRQAAVDGTLSIMVGGPAEGLERVRPVLLAMGTDVFHCGDLGTGKVVKLVNNLLAGCNMAALAEGLTLGVRAGVEPERLVDILTAGSGDSFVLRNHVRKNVLTGDLGEGKFPVDYELKDLKLALGLADDLEMPLLVAPLVRQLYEIVRARGMGKSYYPIVTTFFEELAGVSLRASEPATTKAD